MQHPATFNSTMCQLVQNSNDCILDICLFCRQITYKVMPKRPRHPYLAKIGNLNDGVYRWDCSGAIISPTFILTTSNCLTSE